MIENKSGIWPVGISVLVLPDPILQTTESGIVISTDTQQEREEMGQTDAVVIAISPDAFFDEKIRCKVGDRIIMARHSGMVRLGNDNLSYRLIRDHDVVALLEKE